MVLAPTTTFSSLPPELHLMIYSHLDSIDATCLSLTQFALYVLHRALTKDSPIALATRRAGPNALEAAWGLLGLPRSRTCSHCGDLFCQLHRHVAAWVAAGMGSEVEYCLVTGKFGAVGKGRGCYRSCPPKPRVCGRHGVKGAKGDVAVYDR